MSARGQFEVQLHPAHPLQVSRPDELGLGWPDAGHEEHQREVVGLAVESHGGEVVYSVVREMGTQ